MSPLKEIRTTQHHDTETNRRQSHQGGNEHAGPVRYCRYCLYDVLALGIGKIRAKAEQASETHTGREGGEAVSATPRTDAMERELYETRPSQWEVEQSRLGLCRSLETELAAVTKQRDELAAALRKLKEIEYPELAYEIIENALKKIP